MMIKKIYESIHPYGYFSECQQYSKEAVAKRAGGFFQTRFDHFRRWFYEYTDMLRLLYVKTSFIYSLESISNKNWM